MSLFKEPLESLGIGTRAIKALRRAGAMRVSDVCRLTPKDILGLPNCASTTLREIQQALQSNGLDLSDDRLPDAPPSKRAADALPRGFVRLRQAEGGVPFLAPAALCLVWIDEDSGLVRVEVVGAKDGPGGHTGCAVKETLDEVRAALVGALDAQE